MFKLIFEASYAMSCITEGFRNCGIYPFNPNAIDKSLLLRSSAQTDIEAIDLSAKCYPEHDSFVSLPPVLCANTSPGPSLEKNVTLLPDESCVLSTQNLPDLPVEQASNEVDFDGNKYIVSAIDLGTVSENNYASGTSTDEYMLPMFPELSFTVDDEGILHNAESMSIADHKAVFVQACPPELALSVVELSLTPRKKRRYNEAFQLSIDLPNDKVFHTWKSLKPKLR
jgi:hypothetical protein